MKINPSFGCRIGRFLAIVALLAATVSTTRASYQSVVLNDHPLAYYPLNLAVDTNGVATDLSGNGNDGTYVNIYEGYNNTTGPSAYITNGVSFDGSSTYVDLSTGTNISILNFGGPITMEAWVQPASSTAGGYVMGKGYDASQNADEVEMRLNNGDFHGGTYNGTTGDEGVTGGSETANWTHLVTTYDGTNWNLYQNGSLVTSSPDTVGAINFVDPWAIGDGTVSGNSRILQGNLSQVALYSHALTPAQVAAHYFAGIYGNTNPLPNISLQPASTISLPGATVTFGVTVSSASPLTYAWQKNGVSIAGQTNATLVLSDVQTASGGSYSVVIRNLAGSTNSAAANLSVGLFGYSPVALASGSYNEDTIVEKGALVAATTATMDGGTGNSGTTWFEQGYDSSVPTVGVPTVGSTFISAAQANHSYTMAPSFTTNDVVLIDSTVTQATLTLTTPAAYSALSVAASSGNGSTTVGYAVHHADNTTETGSFTLPDWFSGGTVAVGTGGRLDAGSRAFGNVSSPGNVPDIYSLDASLSDTTSPVKSITLTWSSGTGHACFFAVSGSTSGTFNPIAVTGYNEGMIVSAGAQVFTPDGYTTASMDNGLVNTGNSWYEEGYSTTPWTAPGTGVPPAGSTITNLSAANQEFTMAPSYTGVDDVAYVDATTTATVTPATPQAFYALSFLTGGGHGPISISYSVNHADSTVESGTISAPDWFAQTATPAYVVDGRVDVQSAGLQTWGSGDVVALYAENIALSDISSPVTSINLGTGGGGNAQVFALSGVSTVITNLQNTISSVVKNANGSLSLTASGVSGYSYIVQYTTNLAAPVWLNISTNAAGVSGTWQATLPRSANADGFYRSVLVP